MMKSSDMSILHFTAFMLMLIVFIASNWYALLLFVVVTIFIMWLSQVPFYFLYKGMRPIFILVVFTFLLHLFMTKGGQVWVQLGPISIHEQGFNQGVFLSMRLISIIAITSLVTLTTSPVDLTNGLRRKVR